MNFEFLLSIWRREQCVCLSNALICIIGHLTVALSVIIYCKDHISNVSLEDFLHSHLRLELHKDETAVMTVRMREILSIPKRLCAGGALGAIFLFG